MTHIKRKIIEEDFEEALAKEVAIAGALGSPETPQVTSKIFEGQEYISITFVQKRIF